MPNSIDALAFHNLMQHRKGRKRQAPKVDYSRQSFKTDSPPESEADPGELGGLKFLAYGELLTVFIGMIALNHDYFEKACTDFSDILNLPTVELLTYVAQLTLFILLSCLVVRWMIATQHEFEMWKAWLKNPFTPVEHKAALLAYPLVLGILPAFPNQIVFTSGFMAIYSLSNYWTQWLCNDHFSRAIQITRSIQLDDVKRNVLNVMEHYWLKRPQLGRIATTMFFVCIAFSLALAGAFQAEPWRHEFQLSAYVILILAIFVSEFIIARWRYALDRQVRGLTEQMSEATRLLGQNR